MSGESPISVSSRWRTSIFGITIGVSSVSRSGRSAAAAGAIGLSPVCDLKWVLASGLSRVLRDNPSSVLERLRMTLHPGPRQRVRNRCTMLVVRLPFELRDQRPNLHESDARVAGLPNRLQHGRVTELGALFRRVSPLVKLRRSR